MIDTIITMTVNEKMANKMNFLRRAILTFQRIKTGIVRTFGLLAYAVLIEVMRLT